MQPSLPFIFQTALGHSCPLLTDEETRLREAGTCPRSFLSSPAPPPQLALKIACPPLMWRLCFPVPLILFVALMGTKAPGATWSSRKNTGQGLAGPGSDGLCSVTTCSVTLDKVPPCHPVLPQNRVGYARIKASLPGLRRLCLFPKTQPLDQARVRQRTLFPPEWTPLLVKYAHLGHHISRVTPS